MEYSPKQVWYSFEGGIDDFEIPYNTLEEDILENINPAQIENSLLVKAVKAIE